MQFIKKSKIEIRAELAKILVPNIKHTLVEMEDLVREDGSVTGNLEDYSFEIEIENSTSGMLIKRVDLI